MPAHRLAWLVVALLQFALVAAARADDGEVEGQPLAANAKRLVDALEVLGAPLPAKRREPLGAAIRDRDATKIQELLDAHTLFIVNINPESRVKVQRGKGKIVLQQAEFVPVIVKVLNEGGVTAPLRIASPQAGPGFLRVKMFTEKPMTAELSGLKVEYAIALIHSSESGKREATFRFDVGQGTQDLGFRAEVPILFDIRPASSDEASQVDPTQAPEPWRRRWRCRGGR